MLFELAITLMVNFQQIAKNSLDAFFTLFLWDLKIGKNVSKSHYSVLLRFCSDLYVFSGSLIGMELKLRSNK